SYVFLFQAEDGIRDRNVTGVQTCALPIYAAFDAPKITSIHGMASLDMQLREWFRAEELIRKSRSYGSALDAAEAAGVDPLFQDRSEERRVGREWRCSSGLARYAI